MIAPKLLFGVTVGLINEFSEYNFYKSHMYKYEKMTEKIKEDLVKFLNFKVVKDPF